MQRKSITCFEGKWIDTNDGIPFEACDPKSVIGVKDAMYSTAIWHRKNANRAAGIRIHLNDAAVLGLVRTRQTADWTAVCTHPQVAASKTDSAGVRGFGVEFLQYGAGFPIQEISPIADLL